MADTGPRHQGTLVASLLDEEHARLIVLAANAHDKLVDACHLAALAMDADMQNRPQMEAFQKAAEAVKAALTAVRGKE